MLKHSAIIHQIRPIVQGGYPLKISNFGIFRIWPIGSVYSSSFIERERERKRGGVKRISLVISGDEGGVGMDSDTKENLLGENSVSTWEYSSFSPGIEKR